MLIVPTEAVPDNGEKLQAAVFELAHLNGLDDPYIEWLEWCNRFCQSQLEGVLPEMLEETERTILEQ
jgi:tagaturonate reductase